MTSPAADEPAMSCTVRRIPVERLRAAMLELARGFGCAEADAAQVVDNLLQANLTGHDSHGIGMLPRYAAAYREGGLKPAGRVQVRLDAGTLLGLDGQAGFGQIVGREAMELGIARARTHGSCIVALADAHHLGRIGAWAEMAVEAGLVSLHLANVISRPIVAPWGGSDARFGTNPFAIGIPVPGGEPFILDMATSVIAQGKTRVAYNQGERLAPGQLLDDRGQPTTDPKYGAVEPLGALRTLGEHKGFGLAMACELLGGALAGGRAVHEPNDGRQRVLNGMLSILLDPARLADGTAFAREVAACLDWVRASPPQPGVERVRIAGEPEREARARRLAEGIPVDATTWAQLLDAARSLGRDAQALYRAAGWPDEAA